MELEKYEVTFRTKSGDRWSAFYMAESFDHAEEQAYDGAGADPDEIIKIEKDYKNTALRKLTQESQKAEGGYR